MIFEFSKNIHSPVILFSDHASTNLVVPEVVFRKKLQGDVLFKHRHEPEGSHIIVTKEEVVATGGFMLHYNAPFADLFMEVKEDARKRGVGSYLIQELKRECYLAGRVPAARCNIENMASRAILLKAGMKIAGFMLIGTIR
jgi:GNAT superfamily N-acetyltransferase